MATLTAPPAATGLVCAQCGNPRPPDRERYCSARCASIAMRARHRARRRAAGKRVHSRTGPSAYDKFVAATIPGRRAQVPELPVQQEKARALVERGVAAYENKHGLIRDVGVPKKAENRGRVFKAGPPPGPPKCAFDSRERRRMLRWIRWVMTSDGFRQDSEAPR